MQWKGTDWLKIDEWPASFKPDIKVVKDPGNPKPDEIVDRSEVIDELIKDFNSIKILYARESKDLNKKIYNMAKRQLYKRK